MEIVFRAAEVRTIISSITEYIDKLPGAFSLVDRKIENEGMKKVIVGNRIPLHIVSNFCSGFFEHI